MPRTGASRGLAYARCGLYDWDAPALDADLRQRLTASELVDHVYRLS